MRELPQPGSVNATNKGFLLARINYIGHATVLVDIGQIRVLTDPVLRDRLFFLQRHGKNHAHDLLGARQPDVVLLSHLHYDHADLPSLRMLHDTTTVIAPRGSGAYLKRWAGIQVEEISEGEKVQVGDVEITALPADHGPNFTLPRPMTSCLSYVMRNHLSVYFAGDTDLFEGMYEVGHDFDLDLALLPVWGYSYRVGPGHLTPATAAQALARLHPRIAVPIHWGALRLPGPYALWDRADHMNFPPHDFAAHAARVAPQTEVRVLQPGEWTPLD
ncbi:MAG: MBL fold metallo-hydrolase [Anaerolineae bacterium]|jgi:L-ascorbate metabolism protein UlaG (beta-lactamase superfamily)